MTWTKSGFHFWNEIFSKKTFEQKSDLKRNWQLGKFVIRPEYSEMIGSQVECCFIFNKNT